MTELTPLLLSTTDDLELSLLRSAEGDEPGENALPRAAAALGIGAAAISVAAGAVVAEQAVLGGAALAKPLTLLSLAKWLGIGVTAGVVASGGAHVAVVTVERFTAFEQREAALAAAPAPKNRGTKSARAPEAPAAVAPQPEAIPAPPELADIEIDPVAAAAPAPAPVPAAVFDPAAAAAPALPPPPEGAAAPALPPPPGAAAGPAVASWPIDPPPAAAPATAAPPVASAPAKAPPKASPEEEAAFAAMAAGRTHEKHSAWSLAEELKRLDAVREALRSGRPADAIAYLDAYRKQFPAGSLRTEAVVLRVQALLAAGNRAGAERQAEVLLRSAPESRYADRIRELLAR